ncbi:MAG TPA: 30S ribosomal protein S11 [Candidatus Aminicenantes bacterium]|jgi:small subunit ribosomal protein S11|nr:30S ribosomal protein S11 [Candidatus Aminicenantes bacterium]
MATKKSSSKTKKKDRKVITHGVMFIHSTFNNTIITITDTEGKVLTWASGGMVGFKGSRKSTPFAAQLAAEKALKDAENFGLRSLDVRVKGPGAGRESAIRSIGSTPLQVRSIKDVTPIPHNGCRPPKKRRV